jgi:pyruvate,orthophosphate dikinase
MEVPVDRLVYAFTEGNRHMADLLGGKGANLAEMTRLGLPVPAGFTVTTEACREYLRTGSVPAGLDDEIAAALRDVETTMGRAFGDPIDPLLLSVRSGARFSMPGMMETILDIGLNDVTVEALAVVAGDARSAWDSYRRLIQMYGRTVRGVPAEEFEHLLTDAKHHAGVAADPDLAVEDLRHLVEQYKKVYQHHTGEDFPQEPMVQLTTAVAAVFRSWNTERARVYRRQEHIEESLGTAVNVMAMVFGNLGPTSGTGVAFTRDPATGARGCYGDYLTNAQGEDVVSGVRNTVPLERLADLDARAFAELMGHMSTLEHHYRDLCDIEFTIERGKLWMLQTRVGKRTAAAAFTIAAHLVDEGVIDLDEALRRVNGAQLTQLMFPRFDLTGAPAPLATGVPASPGAATGRVVFDSRRAAAATEPVILVRRETSPDDLPGMIAAAGILTSHGGKTSHAAVVARGMGKTCVCGAEALDIAADHFTVDGVVVNEGDLISIDGTTGAVYLGALAAAPSPIVQHFEGEASADALVTAVDRILAHADSVRRLAVHANADTAADAARARRFGATGIGLCRTEHQFLGERRVLVERLILATDDAERQAALDELLPLQRADFIELFAAMDGLPVTIRLLDPPLHEFLPALDELTARVARADALGLDAARDHTLLDAVRRLHEQNRCSACAACGSGWPCRACTRPRCGPSPRPRPPGSAPAGNPRPEIMIPLIVEARELSLVRAEVERTLATVAGRPAHPDRHDDRDPAGRADGRSHRGVGGVLLLRHQRPHPDDVGLLARRRRGRVPPALPARGHRQRLAVREHRPYGVGALVRTAVADGRAVRPDLTVGVCGEHGGDPASVGFFHEAGLDYVSCSPFRVPVARSRPAAQSSSRRPPPSPTPADPPTFIANRWACCA